MYFQIVAYRFVFWLYLPIWARMGPVNWVRIAVWLFLLTIPCGAGAFSVSIPPVQARTGDGRLVLLSTPHKELLEIIYRRKDGTYDAAALKKIAHLFRSPDGESRPIAADLIEWIDSLQDYFGADTVEIISGYRSGAYNKQLKENGRDVATNSLHTRGRAADIHLDEVTEKILFELARDMHAGGVGFYPSLHFVHLDLGPARFWEEAAGPRKLVGMEANEGPCKIITDRNFYPAKNPKILMTVAGPADCPGQLHEMTFEHFHRGEWKPLSKNTGRPSGKYRLRAVLKNTKTPSSLSNEFYLKID